jgi:hypothetical protein
MATEDNTVVNISGYDPACTFTKNGNTTGVNSITDDLITFTLNAGQTFVLEAALTGTDAASSPNNRGWLGATISSTKKIAVNQGHMGLSVTNGGQDMSMTQITPTSNIGKQYAFIRGNGADNAEFPVIIATENDTKVYVNGESTPIATLNNGEWVQIPSSKYSQSQFQAGNTSSTYPGANMYVEASKNVYAFQTIDASNGAGGTALMDVFQVAPVNCLLDNGVNKIPLIIKTGKSVIAADDLTSVSIMIMASSAINASDIAINYGTGSVNRISSDILTNARKSISGTSAWVTYYVNIEASVAGDVSVYAPGPVAVAYLGLSGSSGVAGYFSGFGTIPTIDVQRTGDGCLSSTTLIATPNFDAYAWYKDNALMPSVTTNSFTPTVAGDYYVVVFKGSCTYPSATQTVYDCNPEVVVTNTASKKYLLPGETTTFTITVKMLGGSAAQNMQISNVLPAHLTYTSSTLTTGTFTGSGSNYTWNVGTMTNGEEHILRVLATAQSVTTPYAETYTVNNTQTFGLGTETNVLADDKTEDVVIYPACSNTLAGTISGAASYCSTTNTTTLTASDAFGDLQWQSSTDNSIFTDIGSATTATLLITNLASTTYYRMKATVDTCVAYSPSVAITVTQGPTGTLSSAAGTNAQSLCENTAITTITYSTSNATGATFSGLPDGVTGSYASNVVTISGTPTATGTFSYTVTLAGSCDVNLTGSILVSNTNNTISLTSASGTDAQAACVNAAITTVSYATTGASGASFTGLPSGVTGAWSNNVVTLTGTPTAAGSYSYTINLLGGCGTVSATGSFTVIQNSIALTSASGTDAQTICTNSAMTNLTYSTTGATGASFSGLPSGVTGTWSNNVVTISGTPTTAGNASFTITLTGGCGTVTETGSLNVTALPTIAISTQGDACATKTTLTATAGHSSYTWYKDNVAIAGVTGDSYTPTAAGDYKVTVSNGSCSNTSAVSTIYTCGLTAEGKMLALSNSVSLLSTEGGANFGTVIDDLGRIVNTTGLTTTVGTIGATTAVIGGVISSTDGIASSVGVIYSTDSNFGTYSTATIQSNAAAGTYTSTLTGLTSLTTYHAKTFIVNLAGTSYGTVISFTTLTEAPTLAATTTVSSIASTTATSGGDITSDGGAAVTARGIVWGTTPNPTIALTTKTADGTGPGTFTSSLTGLTEATLYYVRSYATNAIGTVYGTEISFTTLALAPTLAATTTASSITYTTATSGGDITSDGGSAVTARGIVWGTAPNPTTDLTTKTTDGTGTGTFTSSLTGLTTATLYYVRSYATNAIGTVYGTETSFTTLAVVPTQVYLSRASIGTAYGTAFTTQPQVTIQDVSGNTVTNSSALVTATISPGGTLVGTTTATASSGVATFSNLGIKGTATEYTITYTVSGLTTATQSVTPTALSIGSTGPGGGKVFYAASSGFACGPTLSETCFYLEVAPSSAQAGRDWSPVFTSSTVPNGATGTAIGTGYKNSVAIIAQGNNDPANSAAAYARAYSGGLGSLTDWYLPSTLELKELATKYSSFSSDATFTGAPAVGWEWWTSTEFSSSRAYTVRISDNGGPWDNAKGPNNPVPVRPIRSF